jgi:DNA-binding transcriptional MerR regulator
MTQFGRPPGSWTIDELAASAGTTTRNVRAFQSRGLLPPPHLAGRTGRYDHGHQIRLAAILRLQQRGYSLAAIADLSAAWERGATLEDILGFGAPARRRRPRRPAMEKGDADVISLDELRQWRVPRGNTLALLPGPLLPS